MKLRFLFICFVANILLISSIYAQVTVDQFRVQDHPRVYATEADRKALLNKIRNTEWAQEMYNDIKRRLDPIITKHMTDPEFAISRMQMHWEEGERYVDFYTEGNFVPRREGNAPYPTVRLLYGRAAPGTPPVPPLERLEPYGNGDIPMLKDGQWIIVPFEKTQLGSEDINKWFIERAYEAGILYFFTGDKKYAKFAADVIWTFIRGASYHNWVNPDQDYSANGYLSWETLGDTRRFATLPLAYDFIYDYLKNEYFDSDEFKSGRPGELWAPGHPQGKEWAWDRIHIVFTNFIDNKLQRGGGLQGNWNTNEHESAMLYALALDNNDRYNDGKGREYYVNKLVYGPTDRRRHGAYVDVARANINPETGLWPEPPGGYGQNSIQQLIRFGYVYFVNGIDLIESEPLLRKAAVSFPQMAFPNGYSTGWGDTNYLPIVTEQAELMIAYARTKADAALEETFTNLLSFAGERQFRGMYHMPLFFFVPELKPVTGQIKYPRVSYSPDHSIIFERNLGATPSDSLAYTVAGHGRRSGHRQGNGMTMELYGRGHVLGVDPGWGPDYWVPQHARYNSRIASHNTVVPNGVSPDARRGSMDLEILHAEPEVEAGVDPEVQISPDFQFTDTAGEYPGEDLQADQRRLIGIIRTSDKNGYFVDVFRSKVKNGDDKYHDYIYHNMGRGLELMDSNGKPLLLTDTSLDPNSGLGYEFFEDDCSLEYSDGFRGVFDYSIDDVKMNFWVPGGDGRTVYSLTGPNNHRFYERSLLRVRVPTFMIRQRGQAWEQPFVAVYEPSDDEVAPTIINVRRLQGAPRTGEFVGLAVEHTNDNRIDYILNATDLNPEHAYEDIKFNGIYGVITTDKNGLRQIYLGTGTLITWGDYSIESCEPGRLVKAAFVYESIDGVMNYIYSSDKEVTIRMPYINKSQTRYVDIRIFYKTKDGISPAIETRAIPDGGADQKAGEGILEARLPAAINAHLLIRAK